MELDSASLGLALSFMAVIVSLYALFATRKSDRREVYLRLHEGLISQDLQSGRRILISSYYQRRDLSLLSEQEYDAVNRAVSSLDVAGLYCSRGYISEHEFLAIWAPSLVKMKYASLEFLAIRDRQWPGVQVWPEYRRLVDAAEQYLRQQGVDVDRFVQ